MKTFKYRVYMLTGIEAEDLKDNINGFLEETAGSEHETEIISIQVMETADPITPWKAFISYKLCGEE